jgi:hypothetical protein
LLLDTFARYFTLDEYVPLGGAIAYPLITHNERLLDAPEAETAPHVERLLALDAEYLHAHPERTLFAYFAGRPRKDVLVDDAQLAEWSAEEEAREQVALANGGEYYARTWLQETMLELSERGIAAQHARTWAEELQAKLEEADAAAAEAQRQLDAVRSTRSYRLTQKVVANPLVRKLRGQ